MTKKGSMKQTGSRPKKGSEKGKGKEKEVKRSKSKTEGTEDTEGVKATVEKMWREMKRMRREQYKMKEYVREGFRRIRREVRFLQEVMDESWDEESEEDTEVTGHTEEEDFGVELDGLKQEVVEMGDKKVKWVKGKRNKKLARWLESEVLEVGTEDETGDVKQEKMDEEVEGEGNEEDKDGYTEAGMEDSEETRDSDDGERVPRKRPRYDYK